MKLTTRGTEKYDAERFSQQKIYCDKIGRIWNEYLRMVHNGMSTKHTRIQVGYKDMYTGVVVMLMHKGLPGETDREHNRFTVGHIDQDGQVIRSDAPGRLGYQNAQEQSLDSARNNPAQYEKAWATRRATQTLAETGTLEGEVWVVARYGLEDFPRYLVSTFLRVVNAETRKLLSISMHNGYPVVRLTESAPNGKKRQRQLLLHKLGYDSFHARTPEDLHLHVAHIEPILSTDPTEEAVYKSRPDGVRLLPARDNLMERDPKLYEKLSKTVGRPMLCIDKVERLTGVFHSMSMCTEHTGVPTGVIMRCMQGERCHERYIFSSLESPDLRELQDAQARGEVVEMSVHELLKLNAQLVAMREPSGGGPSSGAAVEDESDADIDVGVDEDAVEDERDEPEPAVPWEYIPKDVTQGTRRKAENSIPKAQSFAVCSAFYRGTTFDDEKKRLSSVLGETVRLETLDNKLRLADAFGSALELEVNPTSFDPHKFQVFHRDNGQFIPAVPESAVTKISRVPILSVELQCPECNVTRESVQAMGAHFYMAHEDVVNACLSCSEGPLPQPFKCAQCMRCFTEGKDLYVHLRDEHQAGPYKCAQCPVQCVDAETFSIHLGKHAQGFECLWNGCQNTYKTEENLRQHVRAEHCGIMVQCHMCSAKYKQQTALTQHIKRDHEKRQPTNPCPACGKVFNMKGMKQHMNHAPDCIKHVVAKKGMSVESVKALPAKQFVVIMSD